MKKKGTQRPGYQKPLTHKHKTQILYLLACSCSCSHSPPPPVAACCLGEELVLGLVPRVAVDLLVGAVDGGERRGGGRGGLLLLVGLLPRAGALGERALVLDVLDPPVVADALGRLEVLLRDGGVVLVGRAEAGRGGLVLVGEGLLRGPVAVLVVVRGVDDTRRGDRLLALPLLLGLGLGLDEVCARRP